MAEGEEDDMTDASRTRRFRGKTRAVIAIVVLASMLAAALWWSPWKSDDSPGQRLASVPRQMCDGLLTAGDVEPLTPLRTGDKLTSQFLLSLTTCRIGDKSGRHPNLFVDVSPMDSAQLDWTVDDFDWRAHLGPGLTGMMQKDSAWLYVPCPGGDDGDLLARAVIRWGGLSTDWPFDPGFSDDERVAFARLLVHAANAEAERAHCRTAPLSDAIPPITPQFSGIRSCGNPPEPPGPPPLLDACSQGIDSLTYRGPLTTWAPEPGTIWNNRLLVTKTSALCGNEAVVWAAWADRLDAERRADIVEHKHRVDEEIRQNGCVVNAQADVTVPAPSG